MAEASLVAGSINEGVAQSGPIRESDTTTTDTPRTAALPTSVDVPVLPVQAIEQEVQLPEVSLVPKPPVEPSQVLSPVLQSREETVAYPKREDAPENPAVTPGEEPMANQPAPFSPTVKSLEETVPVEREDNHQENAAVTPDGEPSVVERTSNIQVTPLLVASYDLLKVEAPKLFSPLSAYRVGAMEVFDVAKKNKRFNLKDMGAVWSVNAGMRVSGGFPYQVGGGLSMTSHVRLAYKLLNDGDGSPVGLEVGFFQGRAGWLNQDNVLYRTEQPASVLLENAPEGASVRYEVYNAWGLEIGLSDFSQLTDWLGIRSGLGLSILSYQQRFEQTSGGEPLDFSVAPQLAQPFGMYWNVGPELRFGQQGHLRLSYHGLVGNNARKAYFPGRNNGLEGVEIGLGWGF